MQTLLSLNVLVTAAADSFTRWYAAYVRRALYDVRNAVNATRSHDSADVDLHMPSYKDATPNVYVHEVVFWTKVKMFPRIHHHVWLR